MQHPKYPTSWTSQTSHIPKIPHPQTPKPRSLLISNILHPKHSTFLTSHIAYPEHSKSWTSYIPKNDIQNIAHPKQKDIMSPLSTFDHSSKTWTSLSIKFIKILILTAMGNIWNQINVFLLYKCLFNIFVKVFW